MGAAYKNRVAEFVPTAVRRNVETFIPAVCRAPSAAASSDFLAAAVFNSSEQTMEAGTVASLKLDRGFGFISRPGEPDLFFHLKSVSDDQLEWNETLLQRRVQFEVEQTPKGERATNVRAAE